MKEIPQNQVVARIRTENPWWESPHRIIEGYHQLRHRGYFNLFFPLVKDPSVRRAVLLMGPRRVGKTVLLHHVIQRLIDDGVPPGRIGYFSVDHPLYNGRSLEDLLNAFLEAVGIKIEKEPLFLFFDEIQYLKGWETHLKVLVDEYPTIKFVASGSAAAALKLKSQESGAGRFTDFLLPPLTFSEYLDLIGAKSLISMSDKSRIAVTDDIDGVNGHFVNYLNFGGYPEMVVSDKIKADPGRFIKSDIIDKVLLRDLPGLYGIEDIQELNYLFTTLAFNTANEVSLEEISRNSGVAKNTIKRYMEYLEAAFLIKIVHRIDRNARRFQRANFFKVYLTNPSMRAALFTPASIDDEVMGTLAETGIFSQWFHSSQPKYYARWQKGEVDIVGLGQQQEPLWAVEVKWSDRFPERPSELRSLLQFCQANKLAAAKVTSRTVTKHLKHDGISLDFIPASLYCYTLGYNLIHRPASAVTM